VREDLPQRLVAKLEEVRAATQGIEGLLVEAAAAGLKRRPETPELTARERAVLGMIVDGMTNREMADALGLSAHTVKDHVSSLYRRLGAVNRAGAVKRAHELRLI
jgi:ATP/maltotriose-dependent transcriptional regulator MalT